MSVFNTDQARHFYVADNVNCFTKIGNGELVKVDPGVNFSKVASDIIDPKKVEYINITTAVNKLVRPRKTATISLNEDILDNGKVPAGYHFILKIIFRQYVSQSDEDRLTKIADVYTAKALTPAEFMTALKNSIDLNLHSEESASETTLLLRTVSNDTLTLTETYMPWKLGKMSVGTLPFDVFAETVEIDSIDTNWAEIETSVANKDSSDTLAGAEKLADLEWFCLGERGDIYRGIGWPNNFETNYQIDPSGTTAYSIVDITYFYSGNNEDIQHSRKTITVALKGVAGSAAATTLKTVFPDVTVKIDGVVSE